MIRYEMKNKTKQAAFIVALPNFMERLQCAGEYGTFNGSYCVGNVCTEKMNTAGEWIVNIPADEVEAIEAYNPNQWNEFPRVTPPIGVLMRIEGFFKSSPNIKVREAARYRGNRWILSNTYSLAEDVQVTRFRPWDDDIKPKKGIKQ